MTDPANRVTAEQWIVRGAVAAFVLLYAAWYPATFSIVDESIYLSTAYAYREGTIYLDEAGVTSFSRVETDGHQVSKFGPLMPLLLVPFTWIDWRAAFMANLVMHLVGFAVFLRLVRTERLPDWTALLYLFHPTLVFYSRTLMSDVSSGVLCLAAYVLVRRPGGASPFLAGMCAGVSCLVRETNAVLVALVLVAVAIEDVRASHSPSCALRWPRFLAGLIVPATVLLAYHEAAFGVWWRGTAGYRGDRGLAAEFGLGEIPGGLLHYGTSLLLVYPGMLIAFFADRRRSLVATLPALGSTLFFCSYYYRDLGPGFWGTAVAGLRFLIPVLPIFLLSYARSLVGLRKTRLLPSTAIAAGLAGAGLAASTLVHARHHEVLRAQEANRVALYLATEDGATILCGLRAVELIHDVWGPRQPVVCEFVGTWTFPSDVPIPSSTAGLYAALVGGDRHGHPGGVPEPLQKLLDDCGAREVLNTANGATLRVWQIDPDRYRTWARRGEVLPSERAPGSTSP